MVVTRRFLTHHKILSLLVIAAILCIRLSNFTENTFADPVEEIIFDVPFLAADDWATEEGCSKVKLERSFDIILTPTPDLHPRGDRAQSSEKPALTVLNLKEIYTRIFIPPEVLLQS
jgi:hypothetical protein